MRMQGGRGSENDEVHNKVGEEHPRHHVGALLSQFFSSCAFALLRVFPHGPLFLHLFRGLPEEQIG